MFLVGRKRVNNLIGGKVSSSQRVKVIYFQMVRGRERVKIS